MGSLSSGLAEMDPPDCEWFVADDSLSQFCCYPSAASEEGTRQFRHPLTIRCSARSLGVHSPSIHDSLNRSTAEWEEFMYAVRNGDAVRNN